MISVLEKKNLIALLQNDAFQSLMMKENGPVERIYNKVSESGISGSDNDTSAQFAIQDFLFDTDFLDKLRNDGADKRAVRMAEKLLVDDDDVSYVKKITYYIDSFIDKVIQSCAGIQSGDFEMIFKEIRQELRKQGKSLVLLVEDITSFTGLNQELLSALFTSHTGENSHDNLCRLISIVGTTTQKLSLFPFTRNAIVNLVDAMDNKQTPRYIIRMIIEPAVNEVINAPAVFPSFCKKWRSQLETNIKNEDIVNRINNIVQNMGLSDSYAEKIRKVIGFWGNSSIEYKNNRLLLHQLTDENLCAEPLSKD